MSKISFVCCVNTLRSAVKRARPRSNSSFSSRMRSIMCSMTSRFLPRSAVSSFSCSRMPASRAARMRAHAGGERVRVALRRCADDVALRGNELVGERGLERRQAASREQRVVAVHLGHQRLLRRHARTPATAGCRATQRRRVDLALDLGVDLRVGLEVVPQAVDLVQDHDAARLRRGVVGDEVAVPDLEVGLRDAGVGGQQEQHRVRVAAAG